ncbi:MAG TPA: PAS domain S-box protein [Syntrophomonadaceae bacterium]|nr:PAS domain S-box protein [Syntrophomonadaceae bacterium]
MDPNHLPGRPQYVLQELWQIGSDHFPRLNDSRWEDLFTTLFTNSPIGIYLAQKGKFVAVNPQFEKQTGFSCSELLNTPPLNLVVEEDRVRVRDNAYLMLKGFDSCPYEFRIIDKRGKTRWVMESVTSVQYEGSPAILGNFMDVTQRQQTESALRESQALYLDLFENANDIIYVHDLQGRLISLNKAGERVIGCPREAVTGLNILKFVVPHQQDSIRKIVRDGIRRGQVSSFEVDVITDAGGTVSLDVRMRLIHKNNMPVAVQGIARDISDRKLIESQFLATNQKLLDIIEFLPDATFVIDRDHRVIAWNRAIEELTGVKKDAIIGTRSYAAPFYGYSHVMLVDLLDQDDPQSTPDNPVVREGQSLYTEVYVPNVFQGTGAYIWAKASPLMDAQGCRAGAIESIRDISEKKGTEDRLRYLSLHDSLTGIYNRTYFEEEMRRLEATRSTSVGLILCDVDGLKVINDTRGHGAGDSLLIGAARVLKDCFRQSDVVARVGGDEFAILTTNSEESTVEQSCSRIRLAVCQYNTLHSNIPLSISIGYAFRNDLKRHLSDIYREADNNMYRDKMQHCGCGR